MQAIINKASSLSIETLKSEIIKLMDSPEDYADTLIEAMTDALRAKLPTAQFVEFCNAI